MRLWHLIIVVLLLVSYPLQAQTDPTQTYTFVSGTTIDLPADWQVNEQPDRIILNGERIVIIIREQAMLLADDSISASDTPEAILETLFNATIATEVDLTFEPERVRTFSLRGQDVLMYGFDGSLGNMLFMMLPLSDGSLSFVQAFALDGSSDSIRTAMTILSTYDSPAADTDEPETTPEPVPSQMETDTQSAQLMRAFSRLTTTHVTQNGDYALLIADDWQVTEDGGILRVQMNDLSMILFSPAVLLRDGFGMIDDPERLLQVIAERSDWTVMDIVRRDDAVTDAYILVNIRLANDTSQIAGSRRLSNGQIMLFMLGGDLQRTTPEQVITAIASVLTFDQTRRATPTQPDDTGTDNS